MKSTLPLALLLVSIGAPEALSDVYSTENFGKIPSEDLLTRVYPEFPDADAIILLDQGEVRVSGRGELRIVRLWRKKIVNDRGKQHADASIPHWNRHKIREFKAHTVLPTGQKIKVKDVYEQGVGDLKERVFTFPAVSPGCVLECYYKVKADFLPPWHFQNDVPTSLSRFVIIAPPILTVRSLISTYRVGIPDPVVDLVMDPDYTSRQLRRMTWTLLDVPAFEHEPFVTSHEDYRATLHFDLGWGVWTWNDLGEYMWKGQQSYLKKNAKDVAKWARAHTDGAEEAVEQARALYVAVRDEIDGVERSESKSLGDVIEVGKGSVYEKNLLLLEALRAHEIEANSVLIRTRDRGRLRPQYTRPDQFNHLLIRTRLGDRTYYLDTSDEYCPFGAIIPNHAVDVGVLLREEDSDAIHLKMPDVESTKKVRSRIELDGQGAITGFLHVEYTGYEALSARHDAALGEEDFARELVARRFPECEVRASQITAEEDADAPLRVSVQWTTDRGARFSGDLLLLEIPFVLGLESNPLEQDERVLPLDFEYGRSSEEVVEVHPPPGFVFDEAPTDEWGEATDATFLIRHEAEGASFRSKRVFGLVRHEIPADRYGELQELYSKLVAADHRTLVMRRGS